MARSSRMQEDRGGEERWAWAEPVACTAASGFDAPEGLRSNATGASSSQPTTNGKAPGYQIPQSNIGYRLLKKAGWQEDRGLGAVQQGPLRPLEAEVKRDKRGIGAKQVGASAKREGGQSEQATKKQRREQGAGVGEVEKAKLLSKKARKRLREAELAREQAFAQALYREFYPDNV